MFELSGWMRKHRFQVLPVACFLAFAAALTGVVLQAAQIKRERTQSLAVGIAKYDKWRVYITALSPLPQNRLAVAIRLEHYNTKTEKFDEYDVELSWSRNEWDNRYVRQDEWQDVVWLFLLREFQRRGDDPITFDDWKNAMRQRAGLTASVGVDFFIYTEESRVTTGSSVLSYLRPLVTEDEYKLVSK